MDKYKILKTFAEIQDKQHIGKITVKDDITYMYCDNNSEFWWNYALVNHIVSNKELKDIEKYFISKSRQSSIYFSDDEKNMPLKSFLQEKGYDIVAKDSWLSWNKLSPEIESSDIIEVRNSGDFEEWINTFIESYPKDDPKNPYGEQTEFAKVLRKSWSSKNNSNDKYYLLYSKGVPIATAILTSYNKIGYISAVGSILSVRGMGFGKEISLHCVKESFKQGNKYHFLATEKGDYPYDFYQRIGFEPKFVSYLFTKNK